MPCRNKADKFCKFCWARKKKTTSPSCSGSNLQVPTSPVTSEWSIPLGSRAVAGEAQARHGAEGQNSAGKRGTGTGIRIVLENQNPLSLPQKRKKQKRRQFLLHVPVKFRPPSFRRQKQPGRPGVCYSRRNRIAGGRDGIQHKNKKSPDFWVERDGIPKKNNNHQRNGCLQRSLLSLMHPRQRAQHPGLPNTACDSGYGSQAQCLLCKATCNVGGSIDNLL